jgi:hypothetical protein
VRPTGAFVACVFLALAGVASAQKVVSPPEIAPPPIPSQPPSPGAGVSEGGKKQTAPENSPQNTDQDKRGTEDSPLTVKLLNTGKSEPEAAQEAQRIKEQTTRERWATNWSIGLTAALVFAAFLQFSGLIGQIFVYRKQAGIMQKALGATTKAADAARDGADAAKQAARVSEAALTRLERPYLFIANIELDIVPLAHLTPFQVNGEPVVEILRIDVSLINHGKTAALVQRMSGCLRIFEQLPAIPEYDPARGGLLVIPPEQMGPRQPFSVEITEDEHRRWQSNEVSLFFIGYVIYDDYFDMQHTTGFCARYSRDAGPGWAKAGERAYNYNRSQKIEETPL